MGYLLKSPVNFNQGICKTLFKKLGVIFLNGLSTKTPTHLEQNGKSVSNLFALPFHVDCFYLLKCQ